ncbi:MAG TPA: protein kinase [Candidatus Udaeobacter sp.]|jgi:serine/threonine-protein kinase|nr:protein kinase [Candidatus Udaeobacter sp.]
MIGRTLGRYRIVERIGEGGMGVVYRAEDPRLEREVALKVIRDDALSSDDVRRRFRQEARTLSRLLHPNIATLFDFDSEGDVDFLVLEYVPGNTLADLLASGPLPEARARAIAIEIAEALHAAHEQGVVHRDLKPRNVAITPRGKAKILDFGLAHVVVDATVASIASTRSLEGFAGTVPYMAPEQIQQHPMDARTDIHGLGLILFEMVSGRRAFAGDDPASLIYRIVHEPAPALSSARPGVSRDLENLVARCLEKSQAARFPDAAALARALRGEGASVSTTSRPDSSSGEGIRSLAVLPFENRSGDPAQDFFADGLTDMLITDLAQIGALRVISRTSAMRFKGTARSLPEIARELNVQAVVEGSAMRAGGRVRVTVQLLDALADQSLWARSYERAEADLITLQSEVAGAIAEGIRVKVTPQEQARLAPKKAVNPAAQVAYLRGRFLWNRWGAKEVRESIACFEEALRADGSYALAYAGLSDAYTTLGTTMVMAPAEAFSKGKLFAQQGLALDDSSAELHGSLANALRSHDWDWAGAEREYLRALELNPGVAESHNRYAMLLMSLDRREEALAEAKVALERDPLSLITYTAVGDVLFYSRRYTDSITYYGRCHEMDPTFGPGNTDLARSLEHVGRYDEALELFRKGTAQPDGTDTPSTGLAIMLWKAGQHDHARRVIAEVKEIAKKRWIAPFGIASFHAVRGETEEALGWLERGYEVHDHSMVFLKVHPRLDALRGEPRFRELLKKMRLDQ